MSPESLLINARQAAKLCGVGRTKWLSMHNAGKIPASVKFGRGIFWRREEIERWITAGCPTREKWEAANRI